MEDVVQGEEGGEAPPPAVDASRDPANLIPGL
jgi:hypothetical protein